MGFHIPKGYLYFAMLFSVFVEGINVTIARKRRRHEATVQHAEAAETKRDKEATAAPR